MPASGGRRFGRTSPLPESAEQSGRLLVFDANLAKRMATEMTRRGRPACALANLGVDHLLDPDLPKDLAARFQDTPWVLVTADDALPLEHAAIVEELQVTVATVDPRWGGHGVTQEQWKWEVVQRWAHAMSRQQAGSVERYSMDQHRRWTPRRGPSPQSLKPAGG